MNNYSDEVEILIKLKSQHLEQLNNISKSDNLSLNVLLNNLITDFLARHDSSHIQQSNYNQKQIKDIVERAIAPLITRIEKLENKATKNIKSSTTEPIKPTKIIPEENRKYLPRHQVWQILKKTTFVQHSGYDNFLKATPQELENYNIFFDTDKKRFYIEKTV
ncbi:hypothetical protein Cyast_1667 [Cyanobacterium stanieri PCC 7202]|uniref:Uncharacterized protein n=1 Tax=Cyanobacterium stanieri (strain ATCC 29140 / PCC 7202) TaxID=292563 RepID=K9YNF3_CYASC|nr:hypothetical protein Cyast_1667 [Cyanobacterium stanieri PCC 7202]